MTHPSAKGRGGPSAPPRAGPSGVRLFVVAVASAVLAWQVISAGLSAYAVGEGRPVAAFRLAPGSADALAGLAQQQLEAGDAESAKASAQRALEASPIMASAVRTLALSDQQAGNLAEASALMGQATALGWRDAKTQLWIVGAARAARDYTATALHADALARTLGTQAFPLLDDLLADPATRPALVARLATRPSWRAIYFSDRTPVPVSSLSARADGLAALSHTSAPAEPTELRSVSNRLADAGDYGASRQLWRLAVPASAANALTDGDFDSVPADASAASFYQWRLSPLPGASADVQSDGRLGTRLHAASSGSTDGVIARQLLVLPPGPHRLAMMSWISASGSEGIRWGVACLPGFHTRFWATPRPGTTAVAPVLDFTVPVTDCPAQQLELRVNHVDPPTSSEAWFDHVSVR